MNDALLTGNSCESLVDVGDGCLLLPEAAAAFSALVNDARAAGFELHVASAHRSFDRQLAIFNGKLAGERPVLDECDRVIDLAALTLDERVAAILRFSALPGGSRHHWGTDLDVYDAGAVGDDYRLQLSQAEVAPGGVFDALHCWLDMRFAGGTGRGFYRPYDRDRGGVAPERWHLSYAPLACQFEPCVDAAMIARCWRRPEAQGLLLREELEARLPDLVQRYLRNVAPPPAKG